MITPRLLTCVEMGMRASAMGSERIFLFESVDCEPMISSSVLLLLSLRWLFVIHVCGSLRQAVRVLGRRVDVGWVDTYHQHRNENGYHEDVTKRTLRNSVVDYRAFWWVVWNLYVLCPVCRRLTIETQWPWFQGWQDGIWGADGIWHRRWRWGQEGCGGRVDENQLHGGDRWWS